MTQKSKNKYNIQDLNIQACSATDCTGLIPVPPQNQAEQESYEQLYPYLTRPVTRQGINSADQMSNKAQTDTLSQNMIPVMKPNE